MGEEFLICMPDALFITISIYNKQRVDYINGLKGKATFIFGTKVTKFDVIFWVCDV